MPLNDAQCRATLGGSKPSKLYDGLGLFLHVKEAGKYWRYEYTYGGKRNTTSYGVYPEIGLKAAREAHLAFRALLRSGVDPKQHKAELKAESQARAEDTFEAVAMEWYASLAQPRPGGAGRPARAPHWRPNTALKHLAHLQTHVLPHLGHRPVAEVTVRELSALLTRVQDGGTEYTASRLRATCSQIFLFAERTGKTTSNPANALRGTFQAPKVRHRPALTNVKEFGVFLRDLAAYAEADPLTLLATRLAILTLLRSSELRGGRWEEIDLREKVWRVPATRMKMGKHSVQSHTVPLSPEALLVIESIRELTGQFEYMFPSIYGGSDGIMSENTIGRTLVRMGYKDRQTLHGFRASARSILSERGWSVAALERQLDHVEKNAVIAAYARSEHLPERVQLMEEWSLIVKLLEENGSLKDLKKPA